MSDRISLFLIFFSFKKYGNPEEKGNFINKHYSHDKFFARTKLINDFLLLK